MAVANRELADLKTVVAPLASAAGRLGDDPEIAEQVLEAVHRGDSAQVTRLFDQMGVRGITHRRTPAPVAKTAKTHEYLSYRPNERMVVDFCLHIEGGK